jgi:hypothetical protein
MYNSKHRKIGWSLAMAWTCCFLMGCKAIPLNDQGLVSKPNMIFSDSPVFAYQSNVLTQIEPGTAGSGGAPVAGCTACQ